MISKPYVMVASREFIENQSRCVQGLSAYRPVPGLHDQCDKTVRFLDANALSTEMKVQSRISLQFLRLRTSYSFLT